MEVPFHQVTRTSVSVITGDLPSHVNAVPWSVLCKGKFREVPLFSLQLPLITSEFSIVHTYWVLNPVPQTVAGV